MKFWKSFVCNLGVKMHMRIGIFGGLFFLFFLDFFWRIFSGGIFWKEFLGEFLWEDFLGEFSWEEFFVYIVKVSQVV